MFPLFPASALQFSVSGLPLQPESPNKKFGEHGRMREIDFQRVVCGARFWMEANCICSSTGQMAEYGRVN